MKLKKICIVIILLCGNFSIFAGSSHRLDSGSLGSTPSFGTKVLNLIKYPFSFTSSRIKSTWICQLLYKEYKTGAINKNINRFFFELDDETAMKVGPKIAEFRRQKANRLQVIKETSELMNYDYRLMGISRSK